MRFKQQRRGSQIPDVNLVPMLDVLMVVLTFFIIVSMTLTTQQGVEIQLPSPDQPAATDEPEPEVAIVKLDATGKVMWDDQPLETASLTPQVKSFLQENPKGFVVLQADEKLPYEQVISLLGEMKAAGGKRVSLAIE